MAFDASRIRRSLQAFDFRNLFIGELGWDNLTAPLEVMVDGASVRLNPIAQKRGMGVYSHPTIPDRAMRMKIERQVAKSVYEHIIIYTDPDQTEQVWQWVRRELGKPLAQRQAVFRRGQTGEPLVQKLQAIAFSLDEEEGLTITDVTSRVRAAFDVERVTKRFYDQFKKEHDVFLRFIEGLPDEDSERWYASVMLNRLMFIYFVQKKGFLDGNPNYLRDKLAQSRGNFYRDFLCALFFEGFAKKESERRPEINRLLGKIPYLNGGLFLPHPIEEQCGPSITIADEAFVRLFDFFDRYQWHLDERPLRADNEINPDVLGYIFEKYINQKQMGAYYTKEDITEYIARNTVIPFLFDQARKECQIAFEGDQSVWRLLQDDPDRYIYDAVKKGTHLPLPEHIAAGVKDVSQRGSWNTPAPEEYALPTEIWREVVARRQRYEDVRHKLAGGEVHEINDLITYNLNIQQFAQDVIANSEGPELLRAFWKAINRVTVLDPTCGSGAFLFAAMNILEPLYEACLDRMEAFLVEPERGRKYADFEQIIERIEQHPNRRYFVLKSIIINNLYGVDIMAEAVEIAKLRLFLKLVAQVDDVGKIEPLPDIDFNIRAGNTLVGFATLDQLKQAITNPTGNAPKLLLLPEDEAALKEIERRAQDVDLLFGLFRQQQTELGGEVTPEDKAELKRRLKALDDELNRYLARQYNADIGGPDVYEKWLASHKPFHWFTEFYGTMSNGGFDVIIGNPPYVAKNRIEYSLPESDFPDIYADVLTRLYDLSSQSACLGMIVPLSITFSQDFRSLREQIFQSGSNWLASFDNIPAAVFEGVSQRCTIWIGHRKPEQILFSAPMYRWRSQYRSILMRNLAYTTIEPIAPSIDTFPKLADSIQFSLLRVFQEECARLKHQSMLIGSVRIGYSQAARNFVSAFIEAPPTLDASSLQTTEPSQIGTVTLSSDIYRNAALAVLLGELFLWYWLVTGDGFHVTGTTIKNYLAALSSISESGLSLLSSIGGLLHNRRYEALVFKKNAGKYVGNYNYSSLRSFTRRADMVLVAELGFRGEVALHIFDYVQRVLSINVFAGEKGIPDSIKMKYAPLAIDMSRENSILDAIDSRLMRYYSFTPRELDFLLNHDVNRSLQSS